MIAPSLTNSAHCSQYFFDIIARDKLIKLVELILHLKDLADEILILVAERVQQLAELEMARMDDILECIKFVHVKLVVSEYIFLVNAKCVI